MKINVAVLSEWLLQCLVVVLCRIIVCLPWFFAYFIGIVIGEVLYWCFTDKRRITRINLSVCFPDLTPQKIDKLVKEHFHYLGVGGMSVVFAWYASLSRLQKLITVRGDRTIDSVSSKKNMIILAPHFIGVELLGIYCSSVYRKDVIVIDKDMRFIDELCMQRRGRFGSRSFSNRRDNIREVVRLISSGARLYYTPDQSVGRKNAVFAPFYKICVATHSSLARITQLTDSQVIPCMLRVKAYGRGFELIVNQPLADYPTGNAVKDATFSNKAIEQLIAYAPAQYLWCHKRFKHLEDESAAPLY